MTQPDTRGYHVTLSDGIDTVGVLLRSPSSLRRLPRGPGVARDNAEQSNWVGGRGGERLSSDTTRFSDGTAWTMTPNMVISAPLANAARGLRSQIDQMPGAASGSAGVQFVDLEPGTFTYLAAQFTADATFTATRRAVILRWKNTVEMNATTNPSGARPAIYVELRSDNSGSPGSAIAGMAAAALDGDMLSEEYEAAWAETPTITSGSSYWVCVHAAANSLDEGHWQVGCHAGSGMCGTITSPWYACNVAPYFRLLDTPADRANHWFFFEYLHALYVYRSAVSGGALYLNGDRGIATGTQVAGTLVDTTKTWTVNEWAGCHVLIYEGSVLEGEDREIASNTANTLTLSTAWSTTPTTGSAGCQYVIQGSHKWTERTDGTTAIARSAPVVCADIVYLPFGNAAAIHRYREYNNGGAWTIENSADADAHADFLLTALNAAGELSLMRFNNGETSGSIGHNVWARATAQPWGTNLTWGTAKPIGDHAGWIQSVALYDGKVYVGKTDGIWNVQSDDIATQVSVEMHPVRHFYNTWNMRGWNTYLYFPVLGGFERLYGSVVDDIGPNRDMGMPAGRQGRITDFVPVLSHAYAAHDAGSSGISALLCTLSPGGNWHELYRAPTGKRIRDVFYQRIGDGGRLWFGCGDDVLSMVMPYDVHNPIADGAMRYRWESHIVTGWIDFNSPALPHYFDALRLLSCNLTPLDATQTRSSRTIEIDYQFNDTGLNSGWRNHPSMIYNRSGYQMGGLKASGRKVRLRFRLLTETASIPTVLKSMDVRGHTINESVYDYTLDIGLEDKAALMRGMEARRTRLTNYDDFTDRDHSRAKDVLYVLDRWSRSSVLLTLRSSLPMFNGLQGHIDPVSLVPSSWNPEDPDDVRLVGAIVFKSISAGVILPSESETLIGGPVTWDGDGDWDGDGTDTGGGGGGGGGAYSNLVYTATAGSVGLGRTRNFGA